MHSLSLHASTIASLQPALSPRLQRAVRLLQLSSQDFAQVVRDALDTNPFLEQEDVPPGVDDDAATDEPALPPPSHAELWGVGSPGRLRHADADGALFDTLEARTSLAGHLLGQLHVLPLSPRDLALASAVVESLDDDGYLRMPLAETADPLRLAPPPQPEELTIALRLVQALDPAGVGARDLAECLQLQLRTAPPGATRSLAERILAQHLQALAAGDLRALARRLGQPPAAVENACAAIRRLDPHPGWRFSEPAVQYVTPDIIVRKIRGEWVATLNEAVVPRVKLNRSYVELFQRHREPRHAELGAHLQEARWTVRNVEQRFSTILSVARAILGRQQHFLAYGAMAMKPLALREIAREVGVHESTVSRVTNNKFMATPCGVFELKYFFSRGLATAGGGACSPTAIRGLIQEMIAAETPGRPLSDVEIAAELSRQGLQVARRTVTKYRQLLRIEPAERRRGRAAGAGKGDAHGV
ncbi:RNA polymerase factor sigma-54 [Ramlibacter sp. RBP-2]|uniref:RNA polymerase sigma-54 factor n=1 Tax=Ramlibacter lithotrophicus TaxID=2606681 RepID=A0A7X6DHK5_9BURK|nr:RNA polymerase factor sigma-54 [Ramlibacter lithotrophicus]NKE67158.1 RNA polymerase factor sigma-54 [Ramlibacter lithotrophicus]